MKYISVNIILTVVFLAYMIHVVKNFAEIFIPPSCQDGERCFTSHLISHPKQDLHLYTSTRQNPSNNDVNKVLTLRDFDYHTSSQRVVELQIPRKTRNNGTLFLFVALADSRKSEWAWDRLNSEASVERIPLVVYALPQAATFNLLKSKTDEVPLNEKDLKPVGHLQNLIAFSVLADPIEFPAKAIPGELMSLLKLSHTNEYLPIVQYNFLKSRMENMVEIKKSSSAVNVSLEYSPASVGKMKLLVQISMALNSLHTMGFNEKNIDDVKGIFADTNLYFLCATIVISTFHLLFDFLAFKNDISFWRAKKLMVGLSVRTVLWRAFSQSIVLLYLFDEDTSMIILIPTFIATLIEVWKVKKMLHVSFDWGSGRLPRLVFASDQVNKAEMRTRAVDAEAMRYLTYLLYPLCILGAGYSLMYQPHKSWYSWTLNSMVNGVYAFGFLFMLPQLFINYKLKSVAALPWRAFMYKAFNTFIDDVFAFIIVMPVAHRVACFRDDIVFLIYLYQRWLYPVDKSRIDDTVSIEETVTETHDKQE